MKKSGKKKQSAEVVEILTMPRERFKKLAATWKHDVRFLSDVNEICSHPAYQQIIGMGAPALPFIFGELEKDPAQWFWALKAITGTDPVPGNSRGNVEAGAKAWLKWADTHRDILELAWPGARAA